eukprot:scaffold2767_cov177-Amphora_coffeaeformis.AAC.63
MRTRRHAAGKGKTFRVCSSSYLFLLVSVTLVTTLWLQVSLTNEFGFPLTGNIERSLARSIRLPPRTWLAFDEFFKKPPPDNVVQEFFRFDDPVYDDIPEVKPFWTCKNRNRHGKLVYLHMYRSAGFSIRAILRAYANLCEVGVAFISNCVDVSYASMEGNEFWMNEGLSSPRKGKECWLSHLENRTGGEYPVDTTNAVNSDLLKENDVDIFGDHLPIGALDEWKDLDGNVTESIYFTFFRDPLEKFVSNYVFANQTVHNSIDETADAIYEIASKKIETNKYLDKTSNHFMSPSQKFWVDDERLEWTHERRTNLTMKNLVDYGVVIGLVERFSRSLFLLQYLIDGDTDLTQMFQFFASPERIDRVNDGSITDSKAHTASIAAAIRSNTTRRLAIDEYLKYEIQIYDFAVKLHHAQFSKLQTKLSPLSES